MRAKKDFNLETGVNIAAWGGGLNDAVKISSHRLQINKLDICIMKGCFIFKVLKN